MEGAINLITYDINRLPNLFLPSNHSLLIDTQSYKGALFKSTYHTPKIWLAYDYLVLSFISITAIASYLILPDGILKNGACWMYFEEL
jgi:hypothetical protein